MTRENIADVLWRAAEAYPHNAAVHDLDTNETWTYQELVDRVVRTASAMRLSGLKDGDRIALLLLNSPQYFEYFFAALASGLVVVPLNTRLTKNDYEHMLTDSGSTVLVTEQAFYEVVEQLHPCVERIIDIADGFGCDQEFAPLEPHRSDGLCTLMYTSGTTGAPKAVMLSHESWRSVAETSLELLDYAGQSATVLHVAPLTHGAGFLMLPTIAVGGTNLTTRSYDPSRTATLIADGAVSGLFLVPSMIRMLLDAVDSDWAPHSSFRWVYYAGSPIATDTFLEASAQFRGRLMQSFGQMESPMFLTFLSANDHRLALQTQNRWLAKTAGRVIPGRTVRIADDNGEGTVGEIIAQAPQIMSGYWNRPQATATTLRDGWLHTGDLGYFDENNLLHVVDRVKDMIVTGGSNVYAREVEDVVVRAPGVEQVAVVGLPHRVWGEEVTAVVVAQPNAMINSDAVREYCRGQLAGYKVPKRIIEVDMLPHNTYGKVLKRELRNELSEAG